MDCLANRKLYIGFVVVVESALDLCFGVWRLWIRRT